MGDQRLGLHGVGIKTDQGLRLDLWWISERSRILDLGFATNEGLG